MPTATTNPAPASVDLPDLLFALYRHRRVFLVCTALGLLAAAAFYLFSPRSYQSETSLLVKYVVERSSVDPVDSQTDVSGRYSDNLIAAEVAILSSWDLATPVAEAVGSDRLLEGTSGERSAARAAGVVLAGIDVKSTKGSNVIVVDFHHRNPALPQPVLEEFVRRYFDKHLAVHRSTQAFDFVSQQKDLVRSRLNDLDFRIQTLREQAGIALLADNDADLQVQLNRTRQELLEAQAEQDQQNARVAFLTRSAGGKGPAKASPGPNAAAPPADALRDYQEVADQTAAARRALAGLLTKYTEGTAEVRTSRAGLGQLEARRAKLEASYPALTATAARASGEGRSPDTLTEQAQLAALGAKVATLKSQLTQLQNAAGKVSAVAPQLADLESQRQAEQKNYADFQAKLERSRIDEALDPSKIPNISVLQKPSPAALVAGKTVKVAAGLAASGPALGLALALGMGLLLDRTVKRPREFERKLQLPLLLTIPGLARAGRALPGRDQKQGEASVVGATLVTERPPWDADHAIRPFAMAIRDRLGLYFDLNGITHKPKLVAVASLSHGAGSSTVAGGLAAALSEDGESKVLLVDMNAGRATVRLFDGKPAYSLASAVEGGTEILPAADNLYLATAPQPAAGATQADTKRLYDLIPTLKASDFDYIVFDMPPLGQTSPTLPMASFMDKLLLIVEANKNDVDLVKRQHAQLVRAGVNVSAIFNKAQPRGPRWLNGDGE